MPEIGQINARLRFERRGPPTDAQKAQGIAEGAWLPLFVRPVILKPVRGGEQVQADRLRGISAFEIWAQYDRDARGLTTDDRAVEILPNARDGRAFNLRWGPEDIDGGRAWLLMHAEQGVAT